jgi:hypothetical protein
MAPHELRSEDSDALRATRTSVETESEEFTALVARIAELRKPREPRRGRPPLWVERLAQCWWDRNCSWSDRDIAAITLYHLIRAQLGAETNEEESPRLFTVGGNLGADLIGPDATDRDEHSQVGCQLIGIARSVGIVAIPPAEGDGGRRVMFTEATLKRLHRILRGIRIPVLRRVRVTPPMGVKTQKPYEMLIDRPDVPARVVVAANKIQGTAWRINYAVLDVLNSREVRLANLDFQKKDLVQKELILGEAAELATLERFYYPVYTDFRGRFYQRGGLLTYTGGSDYARGLLEFADGEALSDAGFKWLTWHMAQMWGHKGIPQGDGTAWIREGAKQLSEIEAGRFELWLKSKQPAQFLAAALAVADASKGLPVHLPVRVDACCSGLQHLALLSADEDLALLVNLWGNYDLTGRRNSPEDPEDNADDFYQLVAVATGFERADVKAVIVPLLYGAGWDKTAEGLAETREKRLSPRQRKDAKRIRDEAELQLPRIFGRGGLLKWFYTIAEAHNEAGLPVRWVAPSGFQAVQDYRYVDKRPKRPDRQVKILVDGEWMNLVKRFYTEGIDLGRQVKSMPANIVHSLDAALLTEIVAESCIQRWGVIHDAFAVSANHVWELLDEDNPRAIRVLYEPDRLTEMIAAWRADGAPMDQSADKLKRIIGDARRPLPAQMSGGRRTLG